MRKVVLAIFYLSMVRAADLDKIQLSGPYTVDVRYDLTLGELAEEGKYDNQISIVDDRDKRRGVKRASFFLVALAKDLGKIGREIHSEIDRVGMRPATKRELLSFGVAYPDEQTKYQILALGEGSLSLGPCSTYAVALYSSVTLPVMRLVRPPHLKIKGEIDGKLSLSMKSGPLQRYLKDVQIDGSGGCSYISEMYFPRNGTRLLVTKARP